MGEEPGSEGKRRVMFSSDTKPGKKVIQDSPHEHLPTPQRLRMIGKSMKELRAHYEQEERESWLGRFKSVLKEKLATIAFLAILGIIAAMLKLGIDVVTDYTLALRVYFISLAGNDFFGAYMLWVLFGIFCVLSSIAITQLVAPTAAGSGIPEMKSILSGVVLEDYLSLKTFVSKVLGLILALGGGLNIGKEGPYVHISSIVANNMCKIPVFRYFMEHESARLQLLGAACAVGISSNFGAPIGGVLFSIEVTATYYLVSNYKKGFFSAIWAALIYKLMTSFTKEGHYVMAVLEVDTSGRRKFSAVQLLFFVILGIACGLLGAAFVKVNALVVKLRRKFNVCGCVSGNSRRTWLSRVGLGIIVATITGLLTFPGALGTEFASRDRYDQADLFAEDTMGDSQNDVFKNSEVLGNLSSNWHRFSVAGSVQASLVILIFVKFFLTVISITLPLPSGVYTPVFTIGAALGRLLGELLESSNLSGGLPPGAFAVVGAASMASGVTQTISAAVITFELTNSADLHLPVLLATLIANAISTAIGPSIYDSMVQLRKLPVLGGFKHRKSLLKPAGDIVNRNVRFLSKETTYQELDRTLTYVSKAYTRIPLVNSPDNMRLIGSVRRSALMQSVEARREEAEHLKEEAQKTLARVDDHANYFNGPVNFDDDERGVPYSNFLLHLAETLPLSKLHFIFSVLSLERAFITSGGRLVGEISKTDLTERDL